MALTCPNCGNDQNFLVKTLQMHVVQLRESRVEANEEGRPAVIEVLCDECETAMNFSEFEEEVRNEVLLTLGARTDLSLARLSIFEVIALRGRSTRVTGRGLRPTPGTRSWTSWTHRRTVLPAQRTLFHWCYRDRQSAEARRECHGRCEPPAGIHGDMRDYYDVLGVATRCRRRRDQAGLPAACSALPSRHFRRRPYGGVPRSRPRLRGAGGLGAPALLRRIVARSQLARRLARRRGGDRFPVGLQRARRHAPLLFRQLPNAQLVGGHRAEPAGGVLGRARAAAHPAAQTCAACGGRGEAWDNGVVPAKATVKSLPSTRCASGCRPACARAALPVQRHAAGIPPAVDRAERLHSVTPVHAPSHPAARHPATDMGRDRAAARRSRRCCWRSARWPSA